MDSLLVASDLSGRSDRAVARAVELARTLGAALCVIHVVDEALPESIAARVGADALDILTASVDAAQTGTPVAVRILSVVGDPVPAIDAAAAECNAQLVIFGIHRRRGYLDGIRETTMERLIRLIDRPSLLVTGRADASYRRILAGLDMSPASASALKLARTLAPAADVSLFHAYHIPFQGISGDMMSAERMEPYRAHAEQVLSAWMAETGLTPDLALPELIEDTPEGALFRQIELHRPDLLAIGAHSRSAINRWLVGSFAARLIRNPPCDLLIAR